MASASTPTPTPTPEVVGKFLGVKPINASKEDLESLKKVVESKNMSEWAKDNKVKKVVGNRCCICGGISTHIATYDYVGATRIERWCSECAEKQFGRKQVV